MGEDGIQQDALRFANTFSHPPKTGQPKHYGEKNHRIQLNPDTIELDRLEFKCAIPRKWTISSTVHLVVTQRCIFERVVSLKVSL